VIIWPKVLERWRREILGARLLSVFGTWQAGTATGGQVMHLIAQRMVDHSDLLGASRTAAGTSPARTQVRRQDGLHDAQRRNRCHAAEDAQADGPGGLAGA
jgi:hypothetical protein